LGELHGSQLATYWGPWLPWDTNLFVGATTLLLAIAALVTTPRHAWRATVLLVGCAWLAMGESFGGRALLDHLPLHDRMRATGRIALFIQLELGVLAGLGWASLTSWSLSGRRGLALLALTMALLVVAAAWWVDARWLAGREPPATATPTADMQYAACICALAWIVATCALRSSHFERMRWVLLVLVLLELTSFTARRVPTFALAQAGLPATTAGWPHGPGAPRLSWASPLESCRGMLAGVPAVWGYGPDVSWRLRALMAASLGQREYGSEYLVPRVPHPLWRQLRVGAQVVDEQLVVTPTAPLPRAWLVADWREVSGPLEAVRRTTQRSFDPTKLAWVEQPLPPPNALPVASELPLAWPACEELAPGRMRVTVSTPCRAVLLISEAYREGWTARIDSQPAAVFPVNGALLGLVLEAGQHQIELSYRPWSWPVGLAVSLLAGLGLVAWGMHRRSSGRVQRFSPIDGC
jgi:hypothetical protein